MYLSAAPHQIPRAAGTALTQPRRSHSSSSTPVHTNERVEFIIPFIFTSFLFVIRKILLCGARKIVRKKIPTLRNKFSLLHQPSYISIWIDRLLQPVSFWMSNFKLATWKSEHEMSGSKLGDMCSWSAGVGWGGVESCLSRLHYLLRLLTPALPGALTRQGFRQCLLQAELNPVLGTMQYLEVRDLGWSRQCALPKIQEGFTYGTKTKWNAFWKKRKRKKEKNESYPDANRIEIMTVSRVWPSGDSQGQCSKK